MCVCALDLEATTQLFRLESRLVPSSDLTGDSPESATGILTMSFPPRQPNDCRRRRRFLIIIIIIVHPSTHTPAAYSKSQPARKIPDGWCENPFTRVWRP